LPNDLLAVLAYPEHVNQSDRYRKQAEEARWMAAYCHKPESKEVWTAIKELPAIDHQELIHELMAKRIVLAVQEGERDVNFLLDSAVALLASLAGVGPRALPRKRTESG
jgi:hypothetical protein